MSRNTHIGRRQRSGRRVLGLFAAVWLNLALQPCAMAFEQDHDCPHCPPAQDQAMAMHHGHDAAADQAPCASMQVQCGDLEEFSVDGRNGQLKIKDVVELPIAITSDIVDPVSAIYRHTYSSTEPPFLAGASPPLRVLYCVYLK